MDDASLIILVTIFGFIAVLAIGLAPYYIAKNRDHPYKGVIGVLGIFGLFTGLLWVVALAWAVSVPPKPRHNKPGRFRVVGVDAESGSDTAVYVDAWNEDNARIKAELKGVIVTKVTRE